MSDAFFESPILNSPYEYPSRHWELDAQGQPTGKLVEARRKADFITPIPKPKKQSAGQGALVLDEGQGVSTEDQAYDIRPLIAELRVQVDRWRALKDPAQWRVTPETARLLQHWRHHNFAGVRPFFCQVEAVETAIWLTEVAPEIGKEGKRFLEHLESANDWANPGLNRLSLKLATGAGKTTVMAMLIAWQTINAVRHPGSKRFTKGFLLVAPGITIRDRLRVLLPSDPDAYYGNRELVPADMLGDVRKARIVITNYHAFRLRERVEMAKGTRTFLQGHGAPVQTQETEGQMLQRVMPELMGMRNIMVINDEAHHCYRAKREEEEEVLKGEERKEAEENSKAAHLWISGLEAVQRKLGVSRVMDLSATPFFLSGSGYREGTLFPWTLSDFSLMDAIECGIVKLPRVPVADNIPEAKVPVFRELWKHIGKKMPKKGRGSGAQLDPLALPAELETALQALYGHYERTYKLWAETPGVDVPPCFIVVCNNTATSKLVYDYISGFDKVHDDGTSMPIPGRLPLFRNRDEHGNPFARPHTLLIDSQQLESGEALDDQFRTIAGPEIEQFRREILERTGDKDKAANITDQELLREVMNTVGKKGRLGDSIRCVVSVSMLTEGWDANTVTHVLGVRAFGTQLLCEQVVGRALRRQSYELNADNRFDVEYADVLGVPFDFTAKPTVVGPAKVKPTIVVKAMSPERDHLEIHFPRVAGYRVEPPEDRLEATFSEDSRLKLTQELVGPTTTTVEGIVGEGVDLTLAHTKDMRQATVIFHLAKELLYKKYRDANGEPRRGLFNDLRRITRQWLDQYLTCVGGTYPAQLLYQELTEMACERIHAAIVERHVGEHPVVALLDPFNPEGSSRHVQFTTSRDSRWQTDAQRCHINWVVLDSSWEGEFCRAVEKHPQVRAYVKNHSLGFEVPYRMGSEARRYRPDFIVLVDDGRGSDDLLHLIVEIKGRRGEDAKIKATTLRTFWVPAINRDGRFGRWAAAEFTDPYGMESDLAAVVEAEVQRVLEEGRGDSRNAS